LVKDKVPSKELRERLGTDDIILIKQVAMVAKRRHGLGEEMYGL